VLAVFKQSDLHITTISIVTLKKCFMNEMNHDQFIKNLKRIEELRKNDILLKKVIKIAQFESELDMGVNPLNFEQANVGYLTKQDFGYIKKVCVLVDKRLQDSNWLIKTLDNIENKYKAKHNTVGGIRFDDELFKVGRGTLETYLKTLDNN
jgi:hypothetical protein